jgi:carboxymethylenebutenolidase
VWGYGEVQDYYTRYFIPKNPPDAQIAMLLRTVGSDRIVDEMIMTFTHSIEMDWMLPGIPPTRRWVELPVLAIVRFDAGLIAGEHLYWDQASVLVQVGLLDPATLPVVGAASAQQLLNPAAVHANQLIEHAHQPRAGSQRPALNANTPTPARERQDHGTE